MVRYNPIYHRFVVIDVADLTKRIGEQIPDKKNRAGKKINLAA